MKKLIDTKDLNGIRKALYKDPALANEGIIYDSFNRTKAHPLHRICDGVFNKKYSDEEGAEMAKIFFEYGAHVNGHELIELQDTPLIAASSLYADALALLYIDHGADIHHAGCHGGTALHWAAWCGRLPVVKRLIHEGAEIDRRDSKFQSTPLFWAIHGLINGGTDKIQETIECAKAIIAAGGDKSVTNNEGVSIFDLLKGEKYASVLEALA